MNRQNDKGRSTPYNGPERRTSFDRRQRQRRKEFRELAGKALKERSEDRRIHWRREEDKQALRLQALAFFSPNSSKEDSGEA